MVNRDELASKITKANGAIKVKVEELQAVFAAPILESCANAADIAKYLSEKYPTLQFIVGFHRGASSVTASPLFTEFKVSNSDYELERAARAAEEAMQNFDTLFPLYIEVAAFAQGYATAYKKGEDKLQSLERDVDNLRNQSHFMMHGPFGCFPGRRF